MVPKDLRLVISYCARATRIFLMTFNDLQMFVRRLLI